ncbi:iron uptake porin [Nostoc sp.]|uniref:iron uptake porin n=1 Tax=Nostoc sp. TaxID=1180 RepID=UPI002FFAE812
MGHKFKNIAIIFQLTFGLLLYFSHPAFAQTSASVLPAKQDKPLVNDTAENTIQGQVTSVSQLSDVKPTDWAFQALQSLIERYGCIAGYSDSTYRGNRALSRYEFAAGVNACLSRVNELLASTTDSLVKKDDLALLQKLQESFAPELATLRGRVDALEVRAATVEKQQFSTTTKLYGNALFSLTAIGGNKKADGSGAPVSRNLIASDFLWLTFDTSFTGKDLLRTRLQASNTPNLSVATGTNMGRLTLDDYDSPNQLTLAKLSYQFKVGDKLSIHIGANDELHEMLDDDVDAVSPLGDHVNGSISLFGQFNPIFAIGGEDVAGGSLTYEFSKAVRLSAAYAAGGNSNNPNSGLFGGTYVGLAELTLRPIDHLTFAFTYTHSYSADDDEANNALDTGTGSINASDPFNGSPTSANSYGVNMAYDVSRKFTLAASAGFTYAHAEGGDNQGANADIVNWSVTAAFPDLGGQGNLGGFMIGLPPKVTSNDVATRVDPNSSLELELFYRYAINDAIAVTPGLIMVTNPEHNSNNDTIYIGTVRTTFSF